MADKVRAMSLLAMASAMAGPVVCCVCGRKSEMIAALLDGWKLNEDGLYSTCPDCRPDGPQEDPNDAAEGSNDDASK